METTAVYFEPRIRTYGFQLDKDLSLLECRINTAKSGLWGAGLETLGGMGVKFHLIFGQIRKNNRICIYLALKESSINLLTDRVSKEIKINNGECRLIASPVEILSFQGPHYKDRYGIALNALESVRSRDIPVIASCCSGSCIYLVLDGGMGDKAHDILSESFEVPPKNSCRKEILRN